MLEQNQIIGATIGADLGTEKIELLDESALAAADAAGASAYTPISPTSAARDEDVSEVTNPAARMQHALHWLICSMSDAITSLELLIFSHCVSR